MVYVINASGVLGYAIVGLNDITGSFFVSLLLVFVILMAIGMFFRIPLEWTAIFLLPLAIGFTIATNSFLPVMVIILIFLGVMLAKHFFFTN